MRVDVGTRAAVLLLVGVLTGCGGQAGVSSGPSEPVPASPAPTPLPTSLPDELPEPLPLPPRKARGGTQTLVGTVVEGVEAGCLLLAGPGGDYLLLGGDPSVVRAGAEVRVVGRVDRSVLTTCQQGVPFTVQSATPAR